mgnify:CR=1 FL=1
MINDLLFFLFMGLVGAVIGWFTNLVAIKLLFRPYKPYMLPLTGWTFQGLIPKRQDQIAEALGNVVSSQLITGQDVALSLGKEETKGKLAGKLEYFVRGRVLDKLPALVPFSLQLRIADVISKIIRNELERFLDNPAKVLQEEDLEDIREEISSIVVNKVKSFDLRQLEEIIYLIARQELKHIELLGGLLGFVIGILQGIVTKLLV